MLSLVKTLYHHKLDLKSRPCVFIGYSTTHNAYRCLDPHTKKDFTSRHVFVESEFTFSKIHSHELRVTENGYSEWADINFSTHSSLLLNQGIPIPNSSLDH